MNSCQLINLNDALDRVGGDKSLYQILLDSFFADNFSCENLCTMISEARNSEAAQYVHRLKGASGSIGAEKLYSACAELEAVLRGKKDGNTAQLAADIKTVFAETITALEDVRKTL